MVEVKGKITHTLGVAIASLTEESLYVIVTQKKEGNFDKILEGH